MNKYHLHFICCTDPVLHRLNTKAANKFHLALKKTRTAGVISETFKNCLQALREGKEPVEPAWKGDEMGQLGSQAWREQTAIGWSHWARGRISVTWRVMQERYYRSHPDMKDQRTKTGKGWAVKMIKGLISMMLEMWAGRCACLHEHTVAEKRRKKSEILGETVRQCYKRRCNIMLEHQDIFKVPAEELIKRRGPYYLQAWINMFYAFEVASARQCRIQDWVRTTEEDSMETFDTIDLEEYLVDTTDGMEREWDIVGNQGAVQTSPLIENMEMVQGSSGAQHEGSPGPLSVDENGGTLELEMGDSEIDILGLHGDLLPEWKHGEVELRKRKPPEG